MEVAVEIKEVVEDVAVTVAPQLTVTQELPDIPYTSRQRQSSGSGADSAAEEGGSPAKPRLQLVLLLSCHSSVITYNLLLALPGYYNYPCSCQVPQAVPEVCPASYGRDQEWEC